MGTEYSGDKGSDTSVVTLYSDSYLRVPKGLVFQVHEEIICICLYLTLISLLSKHYLFLKYHRSSRFNFHYTIMYVKVVYARIRNC